MCRAGLSSKYHNDVGMPLGCAIVVASIKASRQQNFNVKELSAGVYVVRINQQENLQSLKFTLLR
jgi:hypothetical protein